MLLSRLRRSAITLALSLVVCVRADLAADGPRVAIRLYDNTSHDQQARSGAMATTADILAGAGVAMIWRDCSEDVARCDDVPGRGELILRMVPNQIAGRAAFPGSIETRRNAHDAGLAMAFAVVEPLTRVGVLATVFRDRVQLVAERAGIDFNQLLGRAIAHELGHLLLGTMGHSRDGLMREAWTDEELVLNRPEDFVFAPADRIRLLSGLDRRR